MHSKSQKQLIMNSSKKAEPTRIHFSRPSEQLESTIHHENTQPSYHPPYHHDTYPSPPSLSFASQRRQGEQYDHSYVRSDKEMKDSHHDLESEGAGQHHHSPPSPWNNKTSITTPVTHNRHTYSSPRYHNSSRGDRLYHSARQLNAAAGGALRRTGTSIRSRSYSDHPEDRFVMESHVGRMKVNHPNSMIAGGAAGGAAAHPPSSPMRRMMSLSSSPVSLPPKKSLHDSCSPLTSFQRRLPLHVVGHDVKSPPPYQESQEPMVLLPQFSPNRKRARTESPSAEQILGSMVVLTDSYSLYSNDTMSSLEHQGETEEEDGSTEEDYEEELVLVQDEGNMEKEPPQQQQHHQQQQQHHQQQQQQQHPAAPKRTRLYQYYWNSTPNNETRSSSATQEGSPYRLGVMSRFLRCASIVSLMILLLRDGGGGGGGTTSILPSTSTNLTSLSQSSYSTTRRRQTKDMVEPRDNNFDHKGRIVKNFKGQMDLTFQPPSSSNDLTPIAATTTTTTTTTAAVVSSSLDKRNNNKRPPRLAQANTLRTQHQGWNGMPQPLSPPAGDDRYHNGHAKFILTEEDIAKTSIHNNNRMPPQHPMSQPIMSLFIQIIMLLAKVCFFLAMLEMTWCLIQTSPLRSWYTSSWGRFLRWQNSFRSRGSATRNHLFGGGGNAVGGGGGGNFLGNWIWGQLVSLTLFLPTHQRHYNTDPSRDRSR